MSRNNVRAKYDKVPYTIGANTTVTYCETDWCKEVDVQRSLPGNIILIHGVNDVGVSYDKVEQGLCDGLGERLGRKFTPAHYRMPQAEDKGKLELDPDNVFFKRAIDKTTNSPIIPFYWGFREVKDDSRPKKNGQNVDRYGNRLDADLSKGGGPFGNATSTLPDMWNRGFSALPGDLVDGVGRDALRPVLHAPGRMYMILAAKRLAALISMIRDYNEDDTVSLVAHSQGCLLSLLAQAFLMEQGLRPADTLVLTHPPYSLIADAPWTADFAEAFSGGEDALMAGKYNFIGSRQSGHARLQTLINIVTGVAKGKHARPDFSTLRNAKDHEGIIGNSWLTDRDNRGKVYLYFCPEDMTVALANVQGIGWQGVPDVITYKQVVRQKAITGPAFPIAIPIPLTVKRKPLEELGKGFFQRVFTAKLRREGSAVPTPVLVGSAPHEFKLRVKGENDHAHVAEGGATMRMHLPEEDAAERAGIRRITGEALCYPVPASLYDGALNLNGQPKGTHEEVDPIDAAIASTSDYGLMTVWLRVKDPQSSMAPAELANQMRNPHYSGQLAQSPHPSTFQGWTWRAQQRKEVVQDLINKEKIPRDKCAVQEVFFCLNSLTDRRPTGELLVKAEPTPEAARLRWQQSTSPRSFHGAIFGSRANHAQVTAYDVAIGSAKASTDPAFYGYLCAVADWRLKIPEKYERRRSSILSWTKFIKNYEVYWMAEPVWRKKIIKGNADYYSSGELPDCLPVLPDELPSEVVCITT